MPLYIAAILVMIALDQGVKLWTLRVVEPEKTIPVIQDIFHFTYVENRGAAFSLFAEFDSRWIFVALACCITLAILIVLHKKIMQTAMGRWALVLVAAGAIGNAIDRVVRGFVVDVFDFRAIRFPVFNVADIFICVGGVLFVLYFLFQHKEPEQSSEEETSEDEALIIADEVSTDTESLDDNSDGGKHD